MTSSIRDLKVFTTYPHSCSYLSEEEATTLFVDPRHEIDPALYSRLSQIGFRRSGDHIYRPHCSSCSACVPARIPVAHFRPGRGQRRTISRNADLVVEQTAAITDDTAYGLYCHYIEQRHADGDMYPPEREQYESFLNNACGCTRYFRFHLRGALAAVAVIDELLDGWSAIYTFFDPTLDRRSLGVFAILWQIEQARSQRLPYLYLGYWIKGCRKMSYKTRYRPLELYINNQWRRLG